MRLIPPCVSPSYDRYGAVSAAFRPQRNDSAGAVELYCRTHRYHIAVGDLECAQAVTLGIAILRDQQLRARAATGTDGGKVAAPFCAADELVGHPVHQVDRSVH